MSRKHVEKVKGIMAVCKYVNMVIMGLVILFVVGKFMGPVTAMAQNEDKASVEQKAEAGGEEVSAPLTEHSAKVMAFAFLGAAFATGLGSIGAGIAVSNVGAAAMGAVAEKPELMGKSLIYVALAEGIAIYGLLISIVILSKI